MASTLRIRFYACAIGRGSPARSLHDVFDALHGAAAPHWFERGTDHYELDTLQYVADGRYLFGTFCRRGRAELPRRGRGRRFAPANVALEAVRNHFLYEPARALLAYHEHTYGTSVARLQEFLASFAGTRTLFTPILRPAQARPLREDPRPLRKVDLSLQRPIDAAGFPDDPFCRQLLALFDASGAATLNLHMSANGPGSRGRSFDGPLREGLENLIAGDFARTARVEMGDGAALQAIDLVSTRVEVEHALADGDRALSPTVLAGELIAACQAAEPQLASYFGVPAGANRSVALRRREEGRATRTLGRLAP